MTPNLCCSTDGIWVSACVRTQRESAPALSKTLTRRARDAEEAAEFQHERRRLSLLPLLLRERLQEDMDEGEHQLVLHDGRIVRGGGAAVGMGIEDEGSGGVVWIRSIYEQVRNPLSHNTKRTREPVVASGRRVSPAPPAASQGGTCASPAGS